MPCSLHRLALQYIIHQKDSPHEIKSTYIQRLICVIHPRSNHPVFIYKNTAYRRFADSKSRFGLRGLSVSIRCMKYYIFEPVNTIFKAIFIKTSCFERLDTACIMKVLRSH